MITVTSEVPLNSASSAFWSSNLVTGVVKSSKRILLFFYSFVLKVVAGVVDEDFRTANEVLVEGCDSINAIKFGIVDATLSETFGAISAENVSNFKAI